MKRLLGLLVAGLSLWRTTQAMEVVMVSYRQYLRQDAH
jgi:hypothetical protein